MKTQNSMNTHNKEYWNNIFKNGTIYGTYPSETALKAANFLIKKQINKDSKLLEIGGGYGRNAIYFANQLKLDTTIIDISNIAIELGITLAQQYPLKPRFIQGDATRLEEYFPESSYDIVFHNFCLHLLSKSERKKIYEGTKHILKPKGFFLGSYLSTNDVDCPKIESEEGITLKVRGKYQHFFTEAEIKKELSPYFTIDTIIESSDPEKIIDDIRNTEYYFVVGVKNE